MGKLKVGFIPIEGGHFYKDALEEVVRAEDLGFDSVWMEEHHSVVNHYWPSPLPVLAGFATRTSRVLLGTETKGTIPGEPFNRALMKVWLGDHPVQSDLKKAMLGG